METISFIVGTLSAIIAIFVELDASYDLRGRWAHRFVRGTNDKNGIKQISLVHRKIKPRWVLFVSVF